MSLRNNLAELATKFAAGVLQAVRAASLQELVIVEGRSSGSRAAAPARKASTTGATKKRGGRNRRSAAQIQRVVEQILGLLRKTPAGLRSEELRSKLGVPREAMQTPIAEALASKLIKKSGQKRATTYFLPGGGGASAPASTKKSAKAKKKGKRTSAKKRGGKKSAASQPAPAASAPAAS